MGWMYRSVLVTVGVKKIVYPSAMLSSTSTPKSTNSTK